MGSSLSHTAWLWIAILSGLLFLIFDASRYFTHQISPVTLRRWSGDTEQEVRSHWFQYDRLNLRLLNGAMLQIALAVAVLATVCEFGDRVARELMTPRIDVLAFDASRSLHELAQLFSESKYSRIPVYEGSIDRITGFVHIKDVFEVIFRNEPKPVAELARPPYVVS